MEILRKKSGKKFTLFRSENFPSHSFHGGCKVQDRCPEHHPPMLPFCALHSQYNDRNHDVNEGISSRKLSGEDCVKGHFPDVCHSPTCTSAIDQSSCLGRER